MGRHPLSDEEKKRRGTFREEQSDNSRRVSAVGNVLAFPTLTNVPPCSFPLPENGKGMHTYNSWCRDLIEAGLLTKVSLAFIEQLAIADHTIEQAILSGKTPPGRATNDRGTALRRLELLNVDQNLVAGQTKKGVFGKNGFPARLRLSAQHRARRSK